MAGPGLSSFAQRLYDGLEPLQFDEPAQAYDLANYCAALGAMFQIVEDYSRDQVDANGKILDGWSQLLDITRAPVEVLPWLGQFVGVAVTTGLTEAQQRAQIQGVGGFNRGTLASMVSAAQAFLTGTKTVIVRERDPAASASNPAYGLTVITRTSETPDSSLVLAALLSQKPAGIVLVYSTLAGQDYTLALADSPLYSNMFANYATYQGVLTGVHGT